MKIRPKLAQFASCLVLSCSLLRAADSQRKIVERVEPDYPEIARKMQIRGAVKLKVWIRANGSVTRVEYLGGHPLLGESAVKAVQKWKFEVAPDDSTMLIEVKFSAK
jgi:TonB family protein